MTLETMWFHICSGIWRYISNEFDECPHCGIDRAEIRRRDDLKTFKKDQKVAEKMRLERIGT